MFALSFEFGLRSIIIDVWLNGLVRVMISESDDQWELHDVACVCVWHCVACVDPHGQVQHQHAKT